MPRAKPKPVGKPRGRNGGRKPILPGELMERVSVYLPTSAVRQLEARGEKGAVARELILAGLKDPE